MFVKQQNKMPQVPISSVLKAYLCSRRNGTLYARTYYIPFYDFGLGKLSAKEVQVPEKLAMHQVEALSKHLSYLSKEV